MAIVIYSKYVQSVPKTQTTLNMLCGTANWLFFGTAGFGRCRTSKCPFHMSINWACAAHRAVYIANWCWDSHTWLNKWGCLCNSIASWTRTIRSFSDVTGLPCTYYSENSREVSEVIRNISIKVRKGLKGCIPAALMPGFSNVRYRFYSDIDLLTAVLALHERKIAHPFDKCLLT